MTSQTVLPPQVHQVMADHATNTYFMQLREKEEARIKCTPGHHQQGQWPENVRCLIPQQSVC